MQKLSPTQITILEAASTRTDGNIEPLPSNINAGVKQRVINGLLTRQLIKKHKDHYKISATGLTAINAKSPKEKDKPTTSNQQPKRTPRKGSKLAAIVALLKRDGGASLDELCEATDWQQHTLRGTISGSLKKTFELNITSTKTEGKPRYYSITEDDTEVKNTKNDNSKIE